MVNKCHITISVDTDVISAARAQNVNVSQLCNHAIKSYIQYNPDDAEQKKKRLAQQLSQAKMQMASIEAELSTLNSAEEIKRQEEQKEELQKLEQFGQSLKAHNPLEDI